MVDAFGLVVMVMMVVKNERRPKGTRQLGPFRYIETRIKTAKGPVRWNAER
jgi:hypothetical protein